jgi:hypothetical protein
MRKRVKRIIYTLDPTHFGDAEWATATFIPESPGVPAHWFVRWGFIDCCDDLVQASCERKYAEPGDGAWLAELRGPYPDVTVHYWS